MRLTLRTMLAYLDDILDAADADELGEKIEESKFASDLVHRIQNSTRRLRLGAPKTEGKGMGMDANSVAEYLDNTLSADRVPDFEKVCLESDVHLAEVAACHQILTLVLGEPADVEHAIRERIYGVAPGSEKVERPAGGQEAVPHLASVLVAEAKSGRKAAEPDDVQTAAPNRYLSGRSVGIALGLAFLLALVGLRAMGEFNGNHPLWRLARAGAPQVVPEQAAAEPADEGLEIPSSPVEPPTADASTTPAQTDLASRESVPAAIESEDTVVNPTVERRDDTGSDVPESERPEPESVSASPPPGTSGVTPLPATVPDPADTAVSTQLARYLSPQQVVARFDRTEEDWLRLQPDAELATGDELVVLPTYRPQLLIQSGVMVTFVGAARFEIGPEVRGLPEIKLVHGRALLVPASDEGAALSLNFGDREATLRLMDRESAAAVDVRWFLPPGADPETTPAQLAVRVYGLQGQTSWEESGPSQQLISAGELLTVLGSAGAMTQPVSMFPAWTHPTGGVKPIEQRASRRLREYLAADQPIVATLVEHTRQPRQRRVEVRSLANRSLVLFGVYDSLLETLADRGQRSYWADHFAALRFSLTRGSESAAKLQRRVGMAYRAEAAAIFRLLRGYSPDQLAAGAAQELVDLLEHPEMSVRVLAYLNLESITGMTHLFLPFKEPGQDRRGTVSAWRRSLAEGRIVYRLPPVAIPERLARSRVEATVN